MIADKDKDTANTANEAKINSISGYTNAIGASVSEGYLKEEADALALIVDPLAAKEKIETQYANAVIEHNAGKAKLEALNLKLEKAEVVAANAAAALAAGSAADAAAKVAKAEAQVDIDRLSPYLEKAKLAGTRAKAYYDFYN